MIPVIDVVAIANNVKKFAVTYYKSVLLGGLILAKWAIVFSFYVGLYQIFNTVYNLTSNVLNYISDPTLISGNSCMVQNFLHGLNIIGITTSLNATLPLILSALTFVFGVYIYIFGMKLKHKILEDTKAMLRLI